MLNRYETDVEHNRCYKGIIISGIMHLMWQVTEP